MTKAETSRLMGCISAVYPLVDRDRDPQFLVDIWQRVFADTPAALVEQAFYAFIATDTRGYPPTPGALNAIIHRVEQDEGLNEDTAWAMVVRAASRGIYYSGTEFAKLPPEVQRIVGSPGQLCEWSQMNRHDFYAAVENGFRRSWRARYEHEWEKQYFLPAQNTEKLPGK